MTMEFPDDCRQLVVHGLTEDGRTFRPSDWVERLLDMMAVYGTDRRTGRPGYCGPERRREQLAFVRACIIDGRSCLVIDLRLRQANPQAFHHLMEFVRANRLRCEGHDTG